MARNNGNGNGKGKKRTVKKKQRGTLVERNSETIEVKQIAIDILRTKGYQVSKRISWTNLAKIIVEDQMNNLSKQDAKSIVTAYVSENDLIVSSKDFYKTFAWKKVRYKVLKRDEGICQCCGRGREQGVILTVDHIKPRSKYPHLALLEENCQTLCDDCNNAKELDETCWR